MHLLISLLVSLAFAAPKPKAVRPSENLKEMPLEYWQKKLTPEQFRVCRQRGTEQGFSGDLYKKKDAGVYRCSSCEHVLFKSEDKYDAGSPWPTFSAPADPKALELHKEDGWFIEKTEVRCAHCGAHLGTLTDKGPGPSHAEYKVNTSCLLFEGRGKKSKKPAGK